MKRLSTVVASAAVAVSLVACGGSKSNQTSTSTYSNGSNMTQGTSAKYSHRHRGTMMNENGTSGGRTSEYGGGAGSSGGMMAGGAIPRCGAVRAVWVNTHTHVYHEPGDPYYGHTKNGKFMCPRQAVAEGDRPARESGGTSNTGQ